jgi:hypothetical protein
VFGVLTLLQIGNYSQQAPPLCEKASKLIGYIDIITEKNGDEYEV